jgi:hypothetical protein
MRRRRARVLISVLLVAGGLGNPAWAAASSRAGSARPAASDAGPQPAQGDNDADYTCTFLTKGDNVHYSGTDVSGHGWWVNVDCPASLKATVTVWIQEYYSDNSWHTKGTAKATVYAGGGGGRRATARATCTSHYSVSWRTIIDVDLVGVSDSNNIVITAPQTLSCAR